MSSPCTGTDGGGPGTRYSFAELEGLWINAGGSSALAPTMAAIALAESGGCSSDLNTTDNGGTQTSWGLWQISNGTHSSPGADWNTGAGNAALAVAKWKSQGLSAWGTYDSGAYKQFLNGAAPDTSVNGGATAATTTAADSSPDCLISWPSGKVLWVVPIGGGCALGKSQARAIAGVGIFSGGAIVLLFGAILLAAYGLKSSGAGKVAARGLEVAGAGAAVAGADGAAVALHSAGGRVRSRGGASRAVTSAAVSRSRTRISTQRAAAAAQGRQQAAAQRRAAQQPRGRHAKTGANAPPKGKHAAP
jgi:Lysozyme like domain